MRVGGNAEILAFTRADGCGFDLAKVRRMAIYTGVAFTADEAFSLLQKALENQRFAHAYLITGPEGSGARDLAVRLAGLLVKDSKHPLRHPDVHTAEPESKSRRILVDQIRGLEHQLHMRSMSGGLKVGIIFDADRLMEQAANAFLKTLEEPPRNSHLLLVSALPDQLLETILSRCIEVPLTASERLAATERQRRLLGLLREFSAQKKSDMVEAFTLVRRFQALLIDAKEAVTAETDAAFKVEEKHYKQTSDAGRDWLDSREEYYNALSEARYRNERSALIETLEQWWADVLRQQHGGQNLDHPEYSDATFSLAQALATPEVLRRTAAIERLRENSGRNVQEQLALEVAFLEAFAA